MKIKLEDIIRLMIQNQSPDQIARQYHVTQSAVRQHQQKLKTAFHVESLKELYKAVQRLVPGSLGSTQTHVDAKDDVPLTSVPQEPSYVKIRSVNCAAALLANGHRLEKIEKVGERQAIFYFEDQVDTQEEAGAFEAYKLDVDAKTLTDYNGRLRRFVVGMTELVQRWSP